MLQKEEKKKYGIICGSRRYLASVKAGLKKILCRIIDVDDITAMGVSLTENEGRTDIPPWRTIEWVGRMKNKIRNEKGIRKNAKIRKILSEKSALSIGTIKKYLKIYGLPSKVKILLKKKEERTLKENEMIKKYVPYGYKKNELKVGIAELIADNLMEFEDEILFIHSIKLTEYLYEIAKEIIYKLKDDPEKSIDEIYEMVIKTSGFRERTIKLEKNLLKQIENLALKRKIFLDELIILLIKKGIKHF